MPEGLPFSVSFSLAAGAGAQGGYTLVTNFDDPPPLLGVIGASGGSDAGQGIAVGVQYFPEMDSVKDFLGLSLGASAGVGIGPLGTGVDVSFDTAKTGVHVIQGIGPHASVGEGGSALGVGSVGFSLSNRSRDHGVLVRPDQERQAPPASTAASAYRYSARLARDDLPFVVGHLQADGDRAGG